MPYIRLYVPELSADQKREVAKDLTDSVIGALRMPEEARDWLTIHFVTYAAEDLAVGGKLVADGGAPEFYVDYIDLDINQRIKDDLASAVSASIGRAFRLQPGQMGRINFRFQSVSPDEIAMGGHFVRKLITQ
jgi:phenylpyruvate tautomerase PptA (4-oxalocrotonate tautomerase family)